MNVSAPESCCPHECLKGSIPSNTKRVLGCKVAIAEVDLLTIRLSLTGCTYFGRLLILCERH